MKNRPLEGIKVLDFSQVLAAPFCGMMLADMGAEVIKVERPGLGDISREYGPYKNDISLYFCQFNRGKKDIAVDMRSEGGKKVIMDLVAGADIVIENFKYGTLDKMGLGFDDMIKVNPQLIYGSIAGFGTYGPLSHLPCMDIIAAARSGLVGTSGGENEAPIKPGFSLCDTWAGLQLLRGLSMGLLQKEMTGKGCRVDIAMLDCAFYMCEYPVLEYSITGEFSKRTGNHIENYAPYGEFKTKDGNVVIAASSEEQWAEVLKILNLEELAKDKRFSDNEQRVKNREALIAAIEEGTSKRGRYELETALCAAGVPAAAVQSLAEFDNHPETKELKVIIDVNQPEFGDYIAVNTPIRFSKTPVDPNHPAAAHPGENSVEIMKEIGYSDELIDTLLENGSISQFS